MITTSVQSSGNLLLAGTLSVYILIAVYSSVFAYRRLNRPGVSKQIRELFVKKHFAYVLVFIFIWTIQLSQNYLQLFNPQKSPKSMVD